MLGRNRVQPFQFLLIATFSRHVLTVGVLSSGYKFSANRNKTDLYPQQALAEQPIVGDTVGSGPRRWSFGQYLIIAGVIAIVVILVLLGHRYY